MENRFALEGWTVVRLDEGNVCLTLKSNVAGDVE
jgi:hypothetical protein